MAWRPKVTMPSSAIAERTQPRPGAVSGLERGALNDGPRMTSCLRSAGHPVSLSVASGCASYCLGRFTRHASPTARTGRRYASLRRSGRHPVSSRRSRSRTAGPASARLAAALVDLAQGDPGAGQRTAGDLPRFAWLRLERCAGGPLRDPGARRRHAGSARRAGAGPGRADRARLGWLRRLPALPEGARALSSLPRARHRAPFLQPPKPSPQALSRTAYQFILASPGLGAGVLRYVPGLRQAGDQEGLAPATCAGARRSSTATRGASSPAATRSLPPTSTAASWCASCPASKRATIAPSASPCRPASSPARQTR